MPKAQDVVKCKECNQILYDGDEVVRELIGKIMVDDDYMSLDAYHQEWFHKRCYDAIMQKYQIMKKMLNEKLLKEGK